MVWQSYRQYDAVEDDEIYGCGGRSVGEWEDGYEFEFECECGGGCGDVGCGREDRDEGGWGLVGWDLGGGFWDVVRGEGELMR